MTPIGFVKMLGALSFNNTFNPYSHQCVLHDRPNAPRLRSQTLSAMLEAAMKVEVEAI